LGRKHQVHLVCFAPSASAVLLKKKLEKTCKQVEVVVSPYPTAQFREIKPFIFKSLFSPLPFIVFRHQDRKMKRQVEKLIEKERFDAIHIDHLSIAPYLPDKKDCFWVLEEHNLESEINWGIVKKEGWNKFKLFSLLEALKLTIYERVMIPKFDYVLAISKADQRKLTGLGARENRVFFLPTPFETKSFFHFQKKQPIILFIGMLSWWPNKDGFFWFYKKVFPQVRQEIPNVKFVVIGKEATKEMVEADKKDASLDLVGYVKDLEKYLACASVFVVPLRAGSGIRIKILTALSYGLPVVSTKKGAEGIVGRSGQGVILADDPEDFARAVIKVLKDRELADKLSKAGFDFIAKNYNQQKAAKILAKVYL